MTERYNRFRRIFAWAIGILFVFSGILKLMDPVGAGLVMDEYFKFLHLGFLSFISKPAGVAFALIESLTGAALVTGVWRRHTAITTMILMALFTFLTVLLVIFNPSMDCGCFGEIVHLTHWQSLIKNFVIDACCAIAFFPGHELGEPKKKKYGTFAIVSISMVAFMVFSLLFLPLKDYTNYKPGAKLLSALGENEAVEFTATFIYEKDGEHKAFTLEDELPDSSWTFVSSEAVPNKEVETMPILGITKNGEIVDSLAAEGNVIIVSVYNPSRFNLEDKAAAYETLANAEAAGFRPLFLSLEPDENEYQSDYRALVGLNRSNGGVTMISNGTIIKKWAKRKAPDFEELEELGSGEPIEALIGYESRVGLLFQAYLLYTFALLFLL